MNITSEQQSILIVEDDPTMMHIANNRCSAYGYHTHGVVSGEEALDYVQQQTPDLMLVDITLPGIDGLTCIEKMRQLPHVADMLVLVVSSSEQSDQIARAFTLGVDDFIQKPINWQIMMQRIQHLLRCKQLQWQANLLYNAAANSDDAILISDSQNAICYVNPAFSRITGYSRQELIGKNPRILASGKHSKKFYTKMWEQLNSHDNWKGVFTDRRKDGSLFEHRVHISAMHVHGDPALPVSHYISVSSDATQEIEQETLLQERERMASITTMVGGVAHDFNNMLAGITGNTFLMQSKIEQPEKLADHIATINEISDRGARLIKKMLAFTQRDIVYLEELSLNQTIHEAIERLGLPVQYHDPDQECHISVDHHHLEQMLDILLDNARDAIAATSKGVISVRLQTITADKRSPSELKQGKRYAMLSVEDNGHGMDADTQARIFEPFFTTKAVNKGNGLGLSMLYGSMATHQGAVSVQSTIDHGSCFKLYFPLLETRLDASPSVKPVDDQQKLGHLLLVDDEIDIREIGAEILQDAGFKVSTAATGQEALQQVDRLDQAIDLALLDVVMPGINGIELARKLRQKGCRFPIIFCTGYNRHEVIDQTINIDNIDVITKPFSYDKLIDRIKTAPL